MKDIEKRKALKDELRKQFIFGGKSLFTIESLNTKKCFTYKVKQARKKFKNAPKPEIYFVSVLTGSNNESSYSFLGTIFNNSNGIGIVFKDSQKSKISKDALSYKAFDWFIHHIDSQKIKIYHEGRCARCGRTLTVPKSIESGFGPYCLGLSK